jgi:dihydroorotate dehydrogenase (fumarate)
MANLSTTYMGVPLKNPLILGASSLVTKPDMIKQLEEAGIAAFVYRSLFEEQINLEVIQLEDEMAEYTNRNAESSSLFPSLKHAGPQEHLMNLRKFKESTSLPVFASLNALLDETWVEYAKLLEETGIDGLELNFYDVPTSFDTDAASIEKQQVELVKKIKKTVSIPISVKLSSFYTNPLHFIKQLDKAKVDGIVIFNRFFQPEIDTGEETFYYPFELSKERDYQLTLRFAGLLYGNIKASIAGTRGIYESHQALKLLLAGADVLQVVSTVYKNGPKQIEQILFEIETWMDKHAYKELDELKGKLSHMNLKNPYAYQRAQYVDILMNSNEIIKLNPMV